jgi:hypothetical protein
MEAARSLGLPKSRAMMKVIIPQAVRIVIPSLINQFILFCLRYGPIKFVNLTQFIGSIIRLGMFSVQYLTVKVSKADLIKIERRGTIGPRVSQIRANPVDHRHKVIANGGNACTLVLSL